MASTIKIKNGTSGAPSSLAQGELAMDVSIGKLFHGTTGGTAVSSSFTFTEVTASGNISSSLGKVVAGGGYYTPTSRFIDASANNAAIQKSDGSSLDTLQLKSTETQVSNFKASGHITASGNISASSGITASNAFFSGNITSSGTISASGMIQTAGAISSSTGITASAALFSGNITGSGTLKVAGDIHANGHIVGDDGTAIKNISAIYLDSIEDDATEGDTKIDLTGTTLNIDVGGETFLETTGTTAKFHTNITASGTISASGMIQTAGAISSSTGITASDAFFSNSITASNDISASGDITGNDIILTGNSFTMTHATTPTIRLKDTTNNFFVDLKMANNFGIELDGHTAQDFYIATNEYNGTTATTTALFMDGGDGMLSLNDQAVAIDVAGNITASGNISASSADSILTIPRRHLDQTVQGSVTDSTGSLAQGDIYYAQVDVATVPGKIYALIGNGNQLTADKDTESHTNSLLGVAIGTQSATNGYLLRGMVKLHTNPFPGESALGNPAYLGDDGLATGSIAGHASDDFIRVIGYGISGSGTIYFDPDKTFIKKA